jgi:arylsulfatase A-like enzyme
VTQLDSAIGAVLQGLREHRLEENTLVIFTSDNGGGDAGPLRGTKATLFEGGIRVPFIARWPGRISAGTTNPGLATTLELLPTFLAAAGASKPPVKLDGYNLLPSLEGRAPSPRRDMYWETSYGRAARYGEWKWLNSKQGGGLFDLARDIGEAHDLTPAQPERRTEMGPLVGVGEGDGCFGAPRPLRGLLTGRGGCGLRACAPRLFDR